MPGYSCGRALDVRIARDVLGLVVDADGETYTESTAGTVTIVVIPAYSNDDKLAQAVVDAMVARGWRFGIVAIGSKGRVGGQFRRGGSFRAAKPGRSLEEGPIRTAATFACGAMGALVAAFDA